MFEVSKNYFTHAATRNECYKYITNLNSFVFARKFMISGRTVKFYAEMGHAVLTSLEV